MNRYQTLRKQTNNAKKALADYLEDSGLTEEQKKKDALFQTLTNKIKENEEILAATVDMSPEEANAYIATTLSQLLKD